MPVLDLSIRMSSKDLDYMFSQLSSMPHKVPKYIANSLNAAMETGQKYIAKRFAKVTTAKPDRFIKDTRIIKAGENRLVAGVTFYGRPVGAIQFRHQVMTPLPGGGVKFKVGAKDAYQNFTHAFKGIGIGGKDGGNTHLWIRDKRKPKYVVGERAHYRPNVGRTMERIRPLYGAKLITIWQRHPDIKAEAEIRTKKRLHERMLSQVDRALNRKKADRPDFAPALDES